MVTYVDTSALVKLVVAEPETPALEGWLRAPGRRVITSDLARTELLRATRRRGDVSVRARMVLEAMPVMTISTRVFDAAGRLDPPELRSLDALHLACALEFGDELESVLAYDDRLMRAARDQGIPTVHPGA